MWEEENVIAEADELEKELSTVKESFTSIKGIYPKITFTRANAGWG